MYLHHFFQVESVDGVKVKTPKPQCSCATHGPLTLKLSRSAIFRLNEFYPDFSSRSRDTIGYQAT